jgi:hypothetical protein
MQTKSKIVNAEFLFVPMHNIVSNSFVRLLNKKVFLSTAIDFPSFLTGSFVAQYISTVQYIRKKRKNYVRNYAL